MRVIIKIIKWLTGIFITVLLLDIFLVAGFAAYPSKYKKADAIVVLGAAINTPALYNRSMEGLRLFKSGKSDVMILSGGRISDEDITEAGYMKKVIIQNNLDSIGENPKMILEEDSHSTFENLKNSKNKAPEVKSIIIVSDKYHLARAVMLAKRMGFGPVYWSAPDSGYYPKKELYYHYLREVVAMFAYLPKLVLNR